MRYSWRTSIASSKSPGAASKSSTRQVLWAERSTPRAAAAMHAGSCAGLPLDVDRPNDALRRPRPPATTSAKALRQILPWQTKTSRVTRAWSGATIPECPVQTWPKDRPSRINPRPVPKREAIIWQGLRGFDIARCTARWRSINVSCREADTGWGGEQGDTQSGVPRHALYVASGWLFRPQPPHDPENRAAEQGPRGQRADADDHKAEHR